MDREHLCGSGLGDLSLLELLKLQIRLTTSIGAVEAEKTRRTNCLTCGKTPSSVICYPCKHMCVCTQCRPLMCPFCREPVTDRIDAPMRSPPLLPLASEPQLSLRLLPFAPAS
jgi:hypothetical protein